MKTTTSVVKPKDDLWVCIKASELSLTDEFMQHKPNGVREQKLKDSLETVIKNGINNFWRPKIDPTLDKAGNILFKAGDKPAVGKSYNWWCNNAKKFNPKRNSRLGTKSQYVAFIGVLIKTLVAEGWTVDAAGDVVCNDSKKLGNYMNCENAKRNFEPTGSRAIAGFYDLANTRKILAEDEDVSWFWLAGGCCIDYSYDEPLGDFWNYDCIYGNLNVSVGWLVQS